jgi:hypothetical protein
MGTLKTAVYCALLSMPLTSLADSPPTTAPDESQVIEHSHYINKIGQEVHSPAHSKNESVSAGASAKCRDGTFSFSRHRNGTCSHNSGVSQWL